MLGSAPFVAAQVYESLQCESSDANIPCTGSSITVICWVGSLHHGANM